MIIVNFGSIQSRTPRPPLAVICWPARAEMRCTGWSTRCLYPNHDMWSMGRRSTVNRVRSVIRNSDNQYHDSQLKFVRQSTAFPSCTQTCARLTARKVHRKTQKLCRILMALSMMPCVVHTKRRAKKKGFPANPKLKLRSTPRVRRTVTSEARAALVAFIKHISRRVEE